MCALDFVLRLYKEYDDVYVPCASTSVSGLLFCIMNFLFNLVKQGSVLKLLEALMITSVLTVVGPRITPG